MHAKVLSGVGHTCPLLTSPPIPRYKPVYYKVHYSADILEAEVLQPQQLWSTSSFLAIAKGTPPTDFRIRNFLLRDWEELQRASLGVINLLEWFLSTVWKMVVAVEIDPEMRANIDNMLTSSSVAVNHLALMQASNFWLAMLPSAGKDCWTPQFLTGLGLSSCSASQSVEPICSQARSRRHSEYRNKQLLLQAAIKPARRGAAGSLRGPPRAPQRGVFKKRKGFTPSTYQVTHKRPKPQRSNHNVSARGEGKRGQVGRHGHLGQQTEGLTVHSSSTQLRWEHTT